jgi:hypothetical protein
MNWFTAWLDAEGELAWQCSKHRYSITVDPAWEEPKMTDAQKDAIVKTAQACVNGYAEERQSARCAYGLFHGLVDAVRAAEQRWTVCDAGILGPTLECDGKWAWTCMNAQHPASRALVERIARLLNEDDAKT